MRCKTLCWTVFLDYDILEMKLEKKIKYSAQKIPLRLVAIKSNNTWTEIKKTKHFRVDATIFDGRIGSLSSLKSESESSCLLTWLGSLRPTQVSAATRNSNTEPVLHDGCLKSIENSPKNPRPERRWSFCALLKKEIGKSWRVGFLLFFQRSAVSAVCTHVTQNGKRVLLKYYNESWQ